MLLNNDVKNETTITLYIADNHDGGGREGLTDVIAGSREQRMRLECPGHERLRVVAEPCICRDHLESVGWRFEDQGKARASEEAPR